MSVEIVAPGLLTMVQGTPYRGLRHLGMPLAGAADPVALALANWLAGNAAETPAIETAFAPMTLRARSRCYVGVQGAVDHVLVGGARKETGATIALEPGDELHLPAPTGGCRSYVAIHGGIEMETVLGATSTYLPARIGGRNDPLLGKGAVLGKPEMAAEHRTLRAAYKLRHGNDFRLRFVDAAESNWLTNADALTSPGWIIANRADRIGMLLEGPRIALSRAEELASSAVFPGTIQCPPSGQPFLLGPDAQTTGGYPRIAQVIRADRHLIGQLRPGARLRLQRVDAEEARRLYRSKIALIRQLQPDFRLD
jgi:5-oxoprolinase (ATP-hydrolysing) subunit C